ncbi:hypothetical protein [Aporhodopirellula aestuarii]|uniref:Uncharacterized protein n=1 Tax=Aporhodopirellula aestuarii TaxID=2950107 RepID=A0ABT0UE74_9BACT|nr:hypothetical protein [Aporhodopirellula aestuarii]MCM2374576.1 hypothetical protein [Aporhodopirellula aestuarii]
MIDWAVWFGLRCLDEKQPVPHVVILDATRQSNPTTDADRFMAMFPGREVAALPWLTHITAIPGEDESSCLVRLLPAIGQHSPTPPDHDASMIRQLWQSFFLRPTQPSDNHALANVLGASLFLRSDNDENSRTALQRMLTALGLFPDRDADFRKRNPQGKLYAQLQRLVSTLPKFDKADVNLLLVDDSAIRHGWLQFLSEQLGIGQSRNAVDENRVVTTLYEHRITLTGTELTGELLESIRRAISVNSRRLRWGEQSRPIDLLFLDLRLYERESLNLERDFFVRVIDTYESWSTRSKSNGWPVIGNDELTRLRQWAVKESNEKASRSDEMYHSAVTLLARLIAGVDPSLPIVLFSSTNQKVITEELKEYGSIFTQFAKPTLMADSNSRDIDAVMLNLAEAFEHACRLVKARRLCQHIETCKTRTKVRPEQKETGRWNVQLFLDETYRKKRGLVVGGFVVALPPSVDAIQFDAELRSFFLRKLGSNDTYPSHGLPKNKEARRVALLKAIPELRKFWLKKRASVIPFTLCGQLRSSVHSDLERSNVFRDEHVGDNLHRELMRSSLEYACYTLMPTLLPHETEHDLWFHAPTRVQYESSMDAQVLNEAWGIRTAPAGRNVRCHVFSEDDARGILEEIEREYNGSSITPRPVLARAYHLDYSKQEGENELTFIMHHLADAFLTVFDKPFEFKTKEDEELTKKKREEQESINEGIEPLKNALVDIDYGPDSYYLLKANREFAHGEYAQAIFYGTSSGKSIPGFDGAVDVLKDSAVALVGPDCILLGNLLVDGKLERIGNRRLKGKIVQFGENPENVVVIESSGRKFTTTRKYVKAIPNPRIGQNVTFFGVRESVPLDGCFRANDVRLAK